MQGNYPDVFNNSCIKNVECQTHTSNCKKKKLSTFNVKSTKPKVISKPTSHHNQCLNHSKLLNESIVNDNKVDFDTSNNPSWSNQKGYGNIVVGTFDDCSNIHNKYYNWNRIPALTKPYSSPADV